MSASNYLELKLLDAVLGSNGILSRPANLWVALFTTAPTDDDPGVEVSAARYARATVTNNATKFPGASARSKHNGQNIIFENELDGGTSFGLVTSWAIFDSDLEGNMFAFGNMNASRTVVPGDLAQFEAGALVLNITGRCSTYLANKLLDHCFGGPNWTRPANVYLALYDTELNAIADISGATELSGNGYARLAVSNTNTNWPSADEGSKTNGVPLSFAAATGGDWVEAKGWALFDALSGGNMLFFGPLSTPRTVLEDDVFTLPQSFLSITCD